MKNLITFTLMFPNPPGWRPKLAGRSQYSRNQPVSVRRVEPEDIKGQEIIEFPDGFKIEKMRTKTYKAGPRTVIFSNGMLSANPKTYGNFMFIVGPVECKLKNFPGYPTWQVMVQGRGMDVDCGMSPAGRPELANALPLAPKDQAEIVLAAYEKAVGQIHDFDCLAIMLPMTMSLAGGVSPERNMPRFAEATKAAMATLLDKGGCYGDIPEILIRIGEAYEAAKAQFMTNWIFRPPHKPHRSATKLLGAD